MALALLFDARDSVDCSISTTETRREWVRRSLGTGRGTDGNSRSGHDRAFNIKFDTQDRGGSCLDLLLWLWAVGTGVNPSHWRCGRKWRQQQRNGRHRQYHCHWRFDCRERRDVRHRRRNSYRGSNVNRRSRERGDVRPWRHNFFRGSNVNRWCRGNTADTRFFGEQFAILRRGCGWPVEHRGQFHHHKQRSANERTDHACLQR
jgi:hypothetical protein